MIKEFNSLNNIQGHREERLRRSDPGVHRLLLPLDRHATKKGLVSRKGALRTMTHVIFRTGRSGKAWKFVIEDKRLSQPNSHRV